MIKLFIPAPNEDWIGDVTTAEFKHHTRHQIVDSIYDADVVWCYSKWIANHYPLNILQTKPCITTIHHIVPEKGIDMAYFEQFTDVYHVPNAFTRQHVESKTHKEIRLLPYWVPTAFKRIDTPVDLGHKSAFVFGSFQRDTEGATIMSTDPKPKLEKGPDILISVLERFWDDQYVLMLAGWRRQYIKSRVPRHCLIDYTNDNAPDQKAIHDHVGVNKLYNTLRAVNGIYLVTSRYEGGPQAILEAAVTGCRILSTTMGMAPDILHPLCLCGNADDSETINMFEQKIRSGLPWDDIIEFNASRAAEHAISRVMPLYDDLVEETYAKRT